MELFSLYYEIKSFSKSTIFIYIHNMVSHHSLFKHWK